MDLFLLLTTSAINLFLGFVVYARDSRKGYARLFLLMSVVITLWMTANYLTNHYLGSEALVHIANQLTFFAGYAIVVSGLAFTYFFPVAHRPSRMEVGFLGSFVLVTFALSLTPLVSGDATINPLTGEVVFTAGPLVLFYLLSFLMVVGFIAKNLLALPQRGISTRARQQARLVLFGFVISALVGLSINLVIPLLVSGWQITRLGPIATVFMVAVIAYAIVRHRLFDIRLATVRTLAYALSLLSLAAIYGVFALGISKFVLSYDISAAQNIANIIMVLVLAFLFQPIRRFFDRATDRIFYRDQYDTNEFIARLNEVLTSTTDLRTLLQRAATEIGTTLKAEQSYFLVKYADTKHTSAGVKGADVLAAADFEELKTMVSLEKSSIVVVELVPDSTKLGRLLRKKDIAVLMSLRHRHETLGFLALGQQRSSHYAHRDISILETVSDSLLIAIQNALSVQEVREINAHLEQKIDAATKELRYSNAQLKKLDKSKDEFISMASHQLRTPLTAVKGYISMVLDGDMGKITNEQRNVLEQAFESSQRMAYLIGDFLNVSRLQTGKFELELSSIDITSLVREEVDQLVDTARTRRITLKYDQPSETYTIRGDNNKLRQVMMNFIDNAIYYSRAGGKVTVQLLKEPTGLVFKVIDTGIGVPPAERPKLFTKFFRATNARQQRPDGTGIGLYMAKKVVLAHGGTIIFETTEGKGSTFGFRLPLKDQSK